MQRIIQINIAGRLIPIEEDAYLMLRDYNLSLERHFANEEGKEDIIQDIEYRIAELFSIRLQAGTPCIDREDVKKVTETLGAAYTIGADTYTPSSPYLPNAYHGKSRASKRLYRNPNDKMVAGVCGGLGAYFDVDPVIIRLILVVLLLGAGLGLVAYLIAWAVIPMAKTPEEIASLTGGDPLSFEDISRNVKEDLADLKRRGEAMTRDLKDYFNRKK